MIAIGKYNDLRISRAADPGLYLADGDGHEVLLPRRYVTDDMKPGREIRVFVYTDGEDRPVATTDTPYATVGEFAFLQVRDVNATGAFLDWGVMKDLLVPYSEQKVRMVRGGIYPVYVYLDDVTKRPVASARLDRFLGNVPADYRPGTRVKALVISHSDIGYSVIVDNLHRGMIYDNELRRPLEIGQTVGAHVKFVRPDGKIDLAAGPAAVDRMGAACKRILDALDRAPEHTLMLSDSSDPGAIRAALGCSKKDFKKAVGHLYKEGRIMIGEDRISRLSND